MPIEFAHDVHKAAYENVQLLLSQIYGEQFSTNEEFPRFGVARGSAWISVFVNSWGQGAAVEVRAWIVKGVELNLELAKMLLEANNNMVLGGFGIDQHGVFFVHAMNAEGLTKTQLKSSISAVGQIADEYDNKIVEQFGGELMYG